LLAPYAFSVVEKGYLPLLKSEWRQLGRSFDNPRTAALELLYEYGIAGERAALREQRQPFELVDIGAPIWGRYFADPARFFSVSVDGKQHYSIPAQDALLPFASNVDVVVVLGSIRFERWDVTAFCKAHFLVWDYRRMHALAEGEVTAMATAYDNVTLEGWQNIAGSLTQEIFAKPPFGNAE